jgi:hypothetical protein
VAEVVCEVLDAAGTQLTGERVTLDPATAPGEQELRLRRVPAGSGYYARIKGLTAENDTWECGATGPFELRRGAKALVTIVIDRADDIDPGCELVCRSHDDCPANAYCPGPCVRNPSAEECTEALCRRDYIGVQCTFGECGPGFTCLEGAAWPYGYCSAACVSDANCPGRSLCARVGVEQQNRCVQLCEQDDDCRLAHGYTCATAGDGRTACLPPE